MRGQRRGGGGGGGGGGGFDPSLQFWLRDSSHYVLYFIPETAGYISLTSLAPCKIFQYLHSLSNDTKVAGPNRSIAFRPMIVQSRSYEARSYCGDFCSCSDTCVQLPDSLKLPLLAVQWRR